jgi:hypothetical protein
MPTAWNAHRAMAAVRRSHNRPGAGNLARERETMVLMRSSSPIRRTTERLILEPIGPEHADEVWTLHQDGVIAS